MLTPGFSDSAIFDNAFELLVRGGYSMDIAMAMMIPEPWDNHRTMSDARKAFYEFMSCKMEPWDGPASMAFTDGTRIGAVLDRNGLRPSRYWITSDKQLIMASEVGVLEVPQENIVRKGRLEPGHMFMVDTATSRIIGDAELKTRIEKRQAYRVWLDQNRVSMPDRLPAVVVEEAAPLHEREIVFGYTKEDVEILLAPMARDGKEPVGSMGNDIPLAVLSNRPQLLFNYFKQAFAQVTNPPIDPIREELVMSLKTTIGKERNLLTETPDDCRQLFLTSPILTNAQLAHIKKLNQRDLKTKVISTLFDVTEGPDAVEPALGRISAEAEKAVDEDIHSSSFPTAAFPRPWRRCPGCSLWGCASAPDRGAKRSLCGLVVETGEARESCISAC